MRTKGFTLIESLVAVTILTITVAALLFSASRAIITAQNARDQLIASYLAQEGIEYVRMGRDNEFLAVHTQSNASNLGWHNFLTKTNIDSSAIGSCRAPKICILDPQTPDSNLQNPQTRLTQCAGNDCSSKPLYFIDNGLYSLYTQQNSGTPTSFVRSIQAVNASSVLTPSPYNDPIEIQIVSKVQWNFHGVLHSVTTADHLTPWQ